MKVVLLNDEDTTEGPKRAGSTIDHPDAHWLIRLGKAVEFKEPEPAPAPAAETVPAPVEAASEIDAVPAPSVSEVPANDSGKDATSSEDRGAG